MSSIRFVALVAVAGLALAGPALADDPKRSPIYDSEALVVLGELDKVIKDVNVSDEQHRGTYNSAIQDLQKIAKTRKVDLSHLPKAIHAYDQAEKALAGILENAPEIRRLYNQQLDLIGEAVTTAKRMLLSVPDKENGEAQAKLREIGYKMESLAAKIRDPKTPERWKERYRAAFKMWMRVKEQLDRSITDLASMELRTRKQAVVVLEKLYTGVYRTYMARLANYEFMRAAKESYSMSKSVLEKVSDVQRLKQVIADLDPGDFDDMFLEDVTESPVVVDLLDKIVGEISDDTEDEPVEREELESTISQYFHRHEARKSDTPEEKNDGADPEVSAATPPEKNG